MPDALSLPIIDSHVHCRTISSVSGLMKILEATNLRAMNVASRALHHSMNAVSLLAKSQFPGKIYYYASLDYSRPQAMSGEADFAGHITKMLDMGADGVKMFEGKPSVRKEIGLPLDSPAYDDFYEILQSRSTPILFHVGDPEEFWNDDAIPDMARKSGWDYTDGTFPSKESLYREMDGILAKFPKLRIVFAHFYFLSADLARAARFLDEWPTVRLDLTPGTELYGNLRRNLRSAREFFIRYQDRILFGTDNTGATPEAIENNKKKVVDIRIFLETELRLDANILQKIYSGNFIALAGAKPKPLDIVKSVAMCEEWAGAWAQQPGLEQEAATVLEAVARMKGT